MLTHQAYSYDTYYRLFRNRTVKITSPAGEIVIPVRFLMPSADELKMYVAVRRLNEVFEEELVKKDDGALSDGAITEKVRRVVARRTVAKYRESAGIPIHTARTVAYRSGRTEPYRIHTRIEAYLRARA